MIIRTAPRRSSRSAFTLTEVMVVVAILLVLAGVSVTSYIVILDNSKRDVARLKITELTGAVERYRTDPDNLSGNPPDSLEELLGNARAALKPDALIDPWGNPFQYSSQSSHGNDFDIWSQGSNGKPVGNWKD